jgi:hypothetical protein
MAKKVRRKKQTVLTQSQLAGTKHWDTISAGRVSVTAPAPEQTPKAAVDFRQEYQYVVADLKRIGVLAAVMFAVLIALNLVLR